MNHSEMSKFFNLSFFISSDLGFRSKFFFYSFWSLFYPLDPDPWIRIFLIRIQEAKILQIQRIRILSTANKQTDWEKETLCTCPNPTNMMATVTNPLQIITLSFKSSPRFRPYKTNIEYLFINNHGYIVHMYYFISYWKSIFLSGIPVFQWVYDGFGNLYFSVEYLGFRESMMYLKIYIS